jgi:hypothetical protein
MKWLKYFSALICVSLKRGAVICVSMRGGAVMFDYNCSRFWGDKIFRIRLLLHAVKNATKRYFYKNKKTNYLQNLIKEHFKIIELENDKYAIEETDEALEGCFVTARLTPQEEIAPVNVLIGELPQVLVSKFEKVLKQKKGF